jgi:predicted GNAT family N-acyltransferase
MKTKAIQIKTVTWAAAEAYLRAIRTPVFIVEQHVTPEFEWDEHDASATHLLAMAGDEPVACARIIGNKVGRMAVLQAWRGKGYGMALVQKALEIIKNKGEKTALLSAQTHAIGFYLKAGFKVTSDVYQDVHIPHVDMQLELSN